MPCASLAMRSCRSRTPAYAAILAASMLASSPGARATPEIVAGPELVSTAQGGAAGLLPVLRAGPPIRSEAAEPGGEGGGNVGSAGQRNGSHPAPGEGLNDLSAADSGLRGCAIGRRHRAPADDAAAATLIVASAWLRRRIGGAKARG